jgi:hypothetical protein
MRSAKGARWPALGVGLGLGERRGRPMSAIGDEREGGGRRDEVRQGLTNAGACY